MLIRFRAAHILAVLGLLAFAPLAHALTEGFDDISTLPGAGWVLFNNSTPGGLTNWFQGNSGVFDSQAGAADAYIAANFENAPDGGDISNWLMTPTLDIHNGDTLTFWTRTTTPPNDELAPIYPDRLRVWLSVSGTSTSLLDFTTQLLSINEGLATDGYPVDWALYSVTVSGLGGPVSGRYAFEYSVLDTTTNGDYIGIDTVNVESAPVPEPGTLLLLSTGGLALLRRRRQSR